jgi:hypothetical protein
MRSGKYKARAVDWMIGNAETGTEQVAVNFAIVDGASVGETVPWFGFFTEKTEETTLRSLRYCGLKDDDVSDLTSLGENVVEIVVEEDPDPKVRWVNPIGGGLRMKHRMTPEQAKAFAARLKDRRKGKPPSGGSTPEGA